MNILKKTKKAVVLLSGGLDSATCLAIAKAQGYTCFALSFAYGQRHQAELAAAKRIAQSFTVAEHKIIPLALDSIGGSALTNSQQSIPDHTSNTDIPVTYVPARNTVFLAIALGWAEVLEAQDIFIGVSSVDYSGYPDCRPLFIETFQQLANVATKAGINGQAFTIHAPLLHLTKADTIKTGIELGVDYHLTISCYQADDQGRACGRCDSCHLRRIGFAQANIPDPTIYVIHPIH